MTAPQINQHVQTPIGPGVIEATWLLHAWHRRLLVRVRITDTNREHLQDENCMTRQAQIFGLWTYDAEEVETCVLNEVTA